MGDSLTIRPTWWARTLRAFGVLVEAPEEHSAGADYARGGATPAGYAASSAMSAMAAFPWVLACVRSKAADLSGLPLLAVRGDGADAEVLDSHPILDLLAKPASRTSPVQMRRQLIVDLELTGNAYLLALGPREPVSLLRLHPQRVRIIPTTDGQPDQYEFDQMGSSVRYPWDRVLHIRQPSWEDGPEGLWGQGLIRALHNDLTTDLAAQKSAANAVTKGRPDSIISPKNDGDIWSAKQVELIRKRVDKLLTDGGSLILAGTADYKALSWSPRDMEYQNLRVMVRDAVLAASGVPPTRVGLPTANYATSREQSLTYWQGLQAEAALIDAELTRLAQMFDPGVRVKHDFAAVAALQPDRTERVNRVQQWWLMGIPLADAAAFEGFADLPTRSAQAAPVPTQTPTPTTEQEGLDSWMTRGPRLAAAPRTAEDRSTVWRTWIDEVHGPAERGLTLAVAGYFRSAADRIADRLAEVLGQRAAPGGLTRAISQADLDAILDSVGEQAAMVALTGAQLSEATAMAFARVAEEMAVGDLAFAPNVPAETARVQTMARFVDTATMETVKRMINDGLATGASVNDMQAALQDSAAFSPMRALRVARTETTRAVNAGAVQAMEEAQDIFGIKIRKEWLTADDEARDEHIELGAGSPIDQGEAFVVNGYEAQGPGDFGEAFLDINCRCAVSPVVED